MAVGFALVGDKELPPRVLVLCNDGGLLVVDVTQLSPLHLGEWTVVADLSPHRVHGAGSEGCTIYPMIVPPDYTRVGNKTELRRRDGILVACDSNDRFVVVAQHDGTAKLFDVECAIGAGDACGLSLRTRRPYSAGLSDVQSERDEGVNENVENRQKIASSKSKMPANSKLTSHHHPSSRSRSARDGEQDEDDDHDRHKQSQRRHQPASKTMGRPVLTTSQSRSSRNHSSPTSYKSAPRLPLSASHGSGGRGKPSSPHSVAAVRSSGSTTSAAERSSPRPEDDPFAMPLFKLAQLTKKEQRVNAKKLTAFLDRHGT